ncbi:Exo70 domain-containing protein [Pycnococcus provasolii]
MSLQDSTVLAEHLDAVSAKLLRLLVNFDSSDSTQQTDAAPNAANETAKSELDSLAEIANLIKQLENNNRSLEPVFAEAIRITTTSTTNNNNASSSSSSSSFTSALQHHAARHAFYKSISPSSSPSITSQYTQYFLTLSQSISPQNMDPFDALKTLDVLNRTITSLAEYPFLQGLQTSLYQKCHSAYSTLQQALRDDYSTISHLSIHPLSIQTLAFCRRCATASPDALAMLLNTQNITTPIARLLMSLGDMLERRAERIKIQHVRLLYLLQNEHYVAREVNLHAKLRALLGTTWLHRQQQTVNARMRSIIKEVFGGSHNNVQESLAQLRQLELTDVTLRRAMSEAVEAHLWSMRDVRFAFSTAQERDEIDARRTEASRRWREEVGGDDDDDDDDDESAFDDDDVNGIGSCGGARARLRAECAMLFTGTILSTN